VAFEAEDRTGVGFDAGDALPLVAVVVSAFAHHQGLLELLLLVQFLEAGLLAHSDAFELFGHEVEFLDDVVVVGVCFGGEGVLLGMVGMVDVVLVLAGGPADELVLVEECLHALVLLLDDDALAAPGLDVQVQPRDVLGKLQHLLLQRLLLLALVLLRERVSHVAPAHADLDVVLLVLVLILPQQQLVPQLAHRLLLLDAHPHDVVPQLGDLPAQGTVGHRQFLLLDLGLVVLEQGFVQGLEEGFEDVSEHAY